MRNSKNWQPRHIPWGSLLAIFLLCFVQGWLLSEAAVVVGVVFLVSIPVVSIAVCSPDRKIITAPLAAAWSGSIAWTLAESIDNFWHGSLSWLAMVAVTMSMFLVLVFAWAWCEVAISIDKQLGEYTSSIDISLMLVVNSWLGLLLGWFAASR